MYYKNDYYEKKQEYLTFYWPKNWIYETKKTFLILNFKKHYRLVIFKNKVKIDPLKEFVSVTIREKDNLLFIPENKEEETFELDFWAVKEMWNKLKQQLLEMKVENIEIKNIKDFENVLLKYQMLKIQELLIFLEEKAKQEKEEKEETLEDTPWELDL